MSSFPSEVWSMDADGSNQVNLTNDVNDYDSWPSWSGTGDQIAFVRFSASGAGHLLDELRRHGADGFDDRS